MMNPWIEYFDRIGPSVARISGQGAVLAGLVLFVLLLTRSQLAPRWRYVLWGLVIARLLLPVVPESRFSLFNALATGTRLTASDRSERADAPPVESTLPATSPPHAAETNEALDAVPADRRAAIVDAGVRGEERPATVPATHIPSIRAKADQSPAWSPWHAAAIVWIAGAVFFAGRMAGQFVHLRRQSRNWHESPDPGLRAILEECRNRLGIRRHARVLVGPDDCGPAVTGLIHPAILLPERLLTELPSDELRFILLHELSHLRRHDIAAQWVALVARAVHWFNPAAWLAVGRMASERELACDEAVLEIVGADNRHRYSETLIRLAREAHATSLAPGFIATFGDRSSLRRRLETIDGFRRRSRWSAGFALGCIGVACLLGLTDAQSAVSTAAAENSAGTGKLSSTPLPEIHAPVVSDSSEASVDERPSASDTQAQVAAATVADQKEKEVGASGLAEGWKKTVTIPGTIDGKKVYAREGRLAVWVEMGWLLVRRTTAQDDFEWQVVLARASDPTEPAIKVDPASKAIDVAYRGFFVRENAQGKYSVYRERKSNDSPAWPALDVGGQVEMDSFSAGFAIGSRLVDGWRFLQFGHSAARPEIWLRFQPAEWHRRLLLRESPYPGAISLVPLGEHSTEIFALDNRIADRNALRLDDDLFVGFRVTPLQGTLGLSQEYLVKRLETVVAPSIASSEWLNTPAALSLETLRGQVVLLAFGSVESPFSARHLARLQSLQEKLGDSGLSVIGVYPEEGKERLAQRLKDDRITFPIAIDTQRSSKYYPSYRGRKYSGETAGRYDANTVPLYFLIDRRGKLTWGMGIEPPADHEIEPLLRIGRPAPALDVKAWHNAEPNLSLEKLRGKVVLLTFWIAKRGIDPQRQLRELEALRAKYAERDLVVLGVYAPDEKDNAEEILKRNRITFPVMIDAGETEKRYFEFVGYYSGSGTPPKFALIDKAGHLATDLGPLPTDAQMEELLKLLSSAAFQLD